MKKFLTFIFLLNFSLSDAYSIQPDVFVQSTVNRASEVLSKIFQKKKK
jgi:phospholipid transport system substrate-binding protein